MSASPLQIYDRRERMAVRLADLLLAPLAWLRSKRPPGPVRRVLLLRLERIGDLLMVIDAVRDARRAWPAAAIDLVVASWNAPIAALIPEVSTVHVADAPWLERGSRQASWKRLLAAARTWRALRYDIVVNFEPDIRSNFLAWRTGARTRVGYRSGGGGALLTNADIYDTTRHVSTNARLLVARAAGVTAPADTGPSSGRRLEIPAAAAERARVLVGASPRPLVGIHAIGGRDSKQWHLDRFAAVAREVAARTAATIVLTGGPADRQLVEAVMAQLKDVRVVDLAGKLDLPDLAAVLARLDVLVTGDTGPMHLAAAVGTPIVALFGPSNPVRYGPRAPLERIVRVDLPCSPCGQVRLPPERCRGHVPDCMDGITVDVVVRHTLELLEEQSVRAAAVHRS